LVRREGRNTQSTRKKRVMSSQGGRNQFPPGKKGLTATITVFMKGERGRALKEWGEVKFLRKKNKKGPRGSNGLSPIVKPRARRGWKEKGGRELQS